MWVPFAIAAILYLLFRLWYDGIRRPLRADEIAAGLDALVKRGAGDLNDLAAIRGFLEADDGREFVMANLVKVAPGTARHPLTGAEVPARELFAHYTRHFMKKLLRRGGHPALAARKIGPYVDAWGVGPDPGWSIVGTMRYRSRRDMLAMVVDPSFEGVHQFKTLGTAETFSFPTQPVIALYLSPRWWVGLVLLAAAALAALALA